MVGGTLAFSTTKTGCHGIAESGVKQKIITCLIVGLIDVSWLCIDSSPRCSDMFKSFKIHVRENQSGNQNWTIQRNWQHWVHNTQDKGKQNKQTLEKTEGAIKNGQSRETGNIGYTLHRTKANKTQKQKTKTTENEKDKQHRPHQNRG